MCSLEKIQKIWLKNKTQKNSHDLIYFKTTIFNTPPMGFQTQDFICIVIQIFSGIT